MERVVRGGIVAIIFMLLFITACNKSEEELTPSNKQDDEKEVVEEQEETSIETCDDFSKAEFQEKNGIVTIEAESTILNSQWSLEKSLTGYTGSGYLVAQNDFFGNPGNGTLTYKINIQSTGTYRFIWKSRITIGDNNTEHNDNWLRFPNATDFYGLKNGSQRVYPGGSGKTPNPEGSSSDGWFKIYMNNVGRWFWSSRTSDNDPHEIYVQFDEVGVYTMEISARSKGHGIDRMVLFQEDKITEAQATSSLQKESASICE